MDDCLVQRSQSENTEIIIQCRVRIWIYSGESEFNHLNFCTHTCKNSRTQSACNMLTRATYNSGSIFAHSIFNLHLSAKGDETAHNALYWSTLLCVTVAVLNFPFLRSRCHYYFLLHFTTRHTWVPASFVSLLPTIRSVVRCAHTRKQTIDCQIKMTFEIEFVANGHFFLQWDIKITRLTRNNKYFFLKLITYRSDTLSEKKTKNIENE